MTHVIEISSCSERIDQNQFDSLKTSDTQVYTFEVSQPQCPSQYIYPSI
jgi:hypothetical protein